MAKFAVNPDVLAELAGRLGSIASQLESVDHGVTIDESSLGDAALVSAVQAFVDNWSQGRRKIIEEINKVSKVVAEAGRTYGQAEQQIVKGAAGGTVV